jgi:hypothetical protein
VVGKANHYIIVTHEVPHEATSHHNLKYGYFPNRHTVKYSSPSCRSEDPAFDWCENVYGATCTPFSRGETTNLYFFYGNCEDC